MIDDDAGQAYRSEGRQAVGRPKRALTGQSLREPSR